MSRGLFSGRAAWGDIFKFPFRELGGCATHRYCQKRFWLVKWSSDFIHIRRRGIFALEWSIAQDILHVSDAGL